MHTRPGGGHAGQAPRSPPHDGHHRGRTAVGALTGLGADLGPKIALAQEARIKEAKVFPSVCPYCAVGCGTLVHTVGDKIVNIEGNPDSPVNYGNLCPKGAATYQLHVNKNRLTEERHPIPA